MKNFEWFNSLFPLGENASFVITLNNRNTNFTGEYEFEIYKKNGCGEYIYSEPFRVGEKKIVPKIEYCPFKEKDNFFTFCKNNSKPLTFKKMFFF